MELKKLPSKLNENGLTEFVALLDEQLEISGVGLISINMAEQMVSNITEMSYRETAEKITEMTGQVSLTGLLHLRSTGLSIIMLSNSQYTMT